MGSHVEILLSTYNGEKYLSQQLDSLIQQDYNEWTLTIRDDGSTDGTVKIIEQFSRGYSEKVKILKDNLGNLGYNKSFTELMMQSKGDYIMLCDQDDFWEPNKVSELLGAIQKEEIGNPNKGILAFADLLLADENLNTRGASFLKQMRYKNQLGQQIFFLKNYAPGCNTIINKVLLQQALKTKNIVELHDYWLILLSASIGSILYVDKPLMKYRLHDGNEIGMKTKQISTGGKISLFIKDCLKYFLQNKKFRDLMYSKNMAQMENIYSVFPDLISKEAKDFINIDKSLYLARKFRNMNRPYLVGQTMLDQLTYIICF